MTDLVATAGALGATYALLAAAVAVVAAATRTLHLAIGAIATASATLAAILAVTEVTGVAPLLALLAAMAAAAACSAALVPVAFGRTRDPALVVAGLVVAGALVDAASAYGLTARTVRPEVIDLAIGPTATAVVGGAAGALALHLLLRHSRLGRQMRIVGASPPTAERLGVGVARTRAAAFAIAGATATVAAVLAAPLVTLGPAQSPGLTVRGIAAAALLSSRGTAQALAGGLALGLTEAVGARLWPEAGGDVAVGLLVVAVLAARGGAERAWERTW